jgi:hypothetical protein
LDATNAANEIKKLKAVAAKLLEELTLLKLEGRAFLSTGTRDNQRVAADLAKVTGEVREIRRIVNN